MQERRIFVCRRCSKKQTITAKKCKVICSCGKITTVSAMYKGLKSTKSTFGVFNKTYK